MSKITSRILTLIFAVGFYYFTTSGRWIFSLLCLIAAFVMWFAPSLFFTADTEGLGRSIEGDRKSQLKKARKKRTSD